MVTQGIGLTGAALAARNAAINECDALLAVLDTPNIPASFTELLAQCAASTISAAPLGFTDWVGEDFTPLVTDRYVDEALQAMVPPLFFAQTDGDLSLRRSGVLGYNSVSSPFLSVFNITANQTVFDRWTLRCISVTPVERWLVEGDYYGIAGSFIAGQPFSTPFLSFSTSVGSASIGDVVVLEPNLPLVLNSSANAETWNIIRTNPLLASRPVFFSTSLGRILNAGLEVGKVTIDPASNLNSGDLLLTARSGGLVFDATYTADPLYQAVVPVGVPFTDSNFTFTIQPGLSGPFLGGDQFIVSVVNEEARPVNLGLYYGYDVDPYDNPDLVYNNTQPLDANYGVKMDFAFDSRFVDYDVNSIGLQISQSVVDGRSYRFRALPSATQIATLKQNGVIFSHAVDLAAGSAEYDYTLNNALFPTGVTPIFDMLGGTDENAADIYLYISTKFAVEYYDELSSTWLPVGGVPAVPGVSEVDVGVPYSYGGLAFTIQPGSKPFISANANGVEGGDVFAFTVSNPPPYQDPVPAIFVSKNAPWLELHTGSMWRTPAAKWKILFTSSTAYEVSGTYTEGPLAGSQVAGYPVTGVLTLPGTGAVEGSTFKTTELHFTIKASAISFVAGDYFEFETYSRKPSLLVHGSGSGWHPEAVIGEWYWNGSIGFKMEPPSVFKWVNAGGGPVLFTGPDIDVNWVRPDLSDVVYRLKNNGAGTWMVYRSDKGVIGTCAPSFDDGDISFSIDPLFAFDIWIEVRGHEPFKFWKAPFSVVNRSTISLFEGQPGDYIVPSKATHAGVGISLDYGVLLGTPPDISGLFPSSINQSLIDVDTGPGNPPLSLTSPETAVLNGWLPLVLEGRDSATSVAEWPDPSTEVKVKAAATGEPVGRLYKAGALSFPWRFEWDLNFFNTYVPLNTQVNLTIYGNGLNEKMRVSMSDAATFLLGGPVVSIDSLFNESINLTVSEEPTIEVEMEQEESFNVLALDTFDGFLPGFSNLPFDAEDATGLDISSINAASGVYDTGRPLVDAFVRAVYLFYLPSRTTSEEEELANLTGLVGAYLQPGGIGSTTVQQFISAFLSDPYVNGGTDPTLGIPRRGLGIDITINSGQPPAPEATAAQIAEADLTRSLINGSFFDEHLYSSERFDEFADSECFYTVRISGPIEVPSPPVVFPIAYSAVNSPLENRQERYQLFTLVGVDEQPARIFKIQLLDAAGAPLQTGDTWAGPVPTFRFMEPASTVAQVQSVVYRGDSIFEFSLSTAKSGKVVIE
jgi:hypothetical protein